MRALEAFVDEYGWLFVSAFLAVLAILGWWAALSEPVLWWAP